MRQLVELLHTGGHTLVVRNGGIRTFDGRGIADLYRLLREEPELLRGAHVADKVVGKAAASLLIGGGVTRVHAILMSEQATDLFRTADIEVEYDRIVPYIANRSNTGWCPMELCCKDCRTAEECVTAIKQKIG